MLHINTLALQISKYILVHIYEAFSQKVTLLGKIDLTPFISFLLRIWNKNKRLVESHTCH